MYDVLLLMSIDQISLAPAWIQALLYRPLVQLVEYCVVVEWQALGKIEH